MNVPNRVSLRVALVLSVSVAMVCLVLHQGLPVLCLRLERARVERDLEHVVALFNEAQREVEAAAEEVASGSDARDFFSGQPASIPLRLQLPKGLKSHEAVYVALLSPHGDILLGGHIGDRLTSVARLDPQFVQALRSYQGLVRASPAPRGGVATASRASKPTLAAVMPVLSPDAHQTLGHLVVVRFIDDSLVKSIAFRTHANFSAARVEEALVYDSAIRANISKISFSKKPVVIETDDFVSAYGSIRDSHGTTNLVISAVRRRELSEIAAGLRPYLGVFVVLGLAVIAIMAFCLSRLGSAGAKTEESGSLLLDDSVAFFGAASASTRVNLSDQQHNLLSASIVSSDDRIDDLESAIACWWHDIAASSALTNQWSADDVLDIRDVYQRMGRSYRRLLIVFEAFNDCFVEQSDLVMDAYHAKDPEQLLFAMGATKGYLLDVSARKAVTLCGRIEGLVEARNVAEAVALVPSLTEQMRMLFCLISRILSSTASIVSPPEIDRAAEKTSMP